MSKILVFAPHPDDETLGCGGTLFRHKQEGDEIYWAIITEISIKTGWTDEIVKKRDKEIEIISRKYGFSDVFNFRFPTTKIDTLPFSNLIEKIAEVYNKVEPEIIYMPYIYDVHSDHQIISRAIQSTIKWFRFPHIHKVLMYETLSETEFNFVEKSNFNPNYFVDISKQLNGKIEAMEIYESEIADFPFPRSEKNIRSLAAFRGSQCGYEAAEGFNLIYERK